MKELARADYIEKDYIGRMNKLYCKGCGVQIGYTLRRRGFIRKINYAELKMAFEDGSKHVTNGCVDCIETLASDPEWMEAWHDADIALMVKDLDNVMPKVKRYMSSQWFRGTPKFVELDKKRMGIA